MKQMIETLYIKLSFKCWLQMWIRKTATNMDLKHGYLQKQDYSNGESNVMILTFRGMFKKISGDVPEDSGECQLHRKA